MLSLFQLLYFIKFAAYKCVYVLPAPVPNEIAKILAGHKHFFWFPFVVGVNYYHEMLTKVIFIDSHRVTTITLVGQNLVVPGMSWPRHGENTPAIGTAGFDEILYIFH